LTHLADGKLCPGARLARELGTNRREISRLVRRMRGMGIDIGGVPGRGYRLSEPVELLDAARIRGALSEARRRSIHRLEVLFEVESTNTRLLDGAPPPPRSANVALSELQHAGRGRRGRAWVSPFGGPSQGQGQTSAER
jgi:BirA family biotin operon repressor/biotin-[acetyl-CoA-carboxylase] ligase